MTSRNRTATATYNPRGERGPGKGKQSRSNLERVDLGELPSVITVCATIKRVKS